MLGVKEPGSEAEALYQRLWGASPLGFCDLLSRDVNEKGECSVAEAGRALKALQSKGIIRMSGGER